VLLSSMDRMFEQLMDRVDGLTDREYLWEPILDSWSVRATGDGAPEVDGGACAKILQPPLRRLRGGRGTSRSTVSMTTRDALVAGAWRLVGFVVTSLSNRYGDACQ